MAEALGVLIIQALTAETFAAAGGWAVTVTAAPSAFTAGLVGSAALLGISTAAAFLAQPQVPKQPDGAQPLKQSIPARPRGYGRARLSGSYMLYDVQSLWSFDIFAIHDGKISGFVYYFLNDDLVTIDGNGGVNSIVGVSANRYVAYTSSHHVYFATRLGLATETAFPVRASGFSPPSAIPNWTAKHRGDGVASLYMECRQPGASDFLEHFPRGLPKPSVVCDLAPIYDPRDGGQSRSDASTWAISRNPVLQLIDYLTNADAGGPGLDWDTLIAPSLTSLMAQADYCDELVTCNDGHTEPRYQSAGWYFKTNDPAEVIGSILATCDGWMAETGDGSLALYVGKYQTPTVTLTDDHIVGFNIDFGVADEELINEIRSSYTAIDSDYREGAARPWQDATSIAEVGKIRSTSVQRPWVQSWSQSRRLDKRLMARHQAKRGTLQCSMYGLKVLGQRWVRVQSSTIDTLSNAVIEITGATLDLLNGRVSLEWFLVNPNSIDAWDPATEEGQAPANFFGNLTLRLKKPTTPSGAKVGSTIQVQFDDDTAETAIVGHVVEWKLSSSSNEWTRKYFPNPVTPSGGKITLTTPAVAAGTYDVRIASVGVDYVLSQWTDATINNAAGSSIAAVAISVTI